MASEIAKRIDGAIKLGIAPMLKEHGFRKKGRNFHKTSGEAVQVVNIQGYRWNEGNTGKFTVNIAVYFRTVAEITERWVVDGVPTEAECTVRNRLGFLMPGQEDKWWVLGKRVWWFWEKKDDDQVAKSVAETLRNYGLPWLERASTRDGLRSTFEKGGGLSTPARQSRLKYWTGTRSRRRRCCGNELRRARITRASSNR